MCVCVWSQAIRQWKKRDRFNEFRVANKWVIDEKFYALKEKWNRNGIAHKPSRNRESGWRRNEGNEIKRVDWCEEIENERASKRARVIEWSEQMHEKNYERIVWANRSWKIPPSHACAHTCVV